MIEFYLFILCLLVLLVIIIATNQPWKCEICGNDFSSEDIKYSNPIEPEMKICEKCLDVVCDKNRKKYKLLSIKLEKENVSSGSLSGNIFAVSGGFSLKNEPYFYFYRVSDDGGAKLEKVASDGCIIYQDEEVSPYVEIKKFCSCNKIPWAKLHIPQNSISNLIDLNL